jgi:hypothetical protein
MLIGYCGIDRSRKEHSQWIGLSNKDILERFHDTFDNIVLPMKMEEYLLPKFPGKIDYYGHAKTYILYRFDYCISGTKCVWISCFRKFYYSLTRKNLVAKFQDKKLTNGYCIS